MRRVFTAMLAILLLGLSSGYKLQAQAPPPAGAPPALAILPLKEEGRKDLGDVSDTMNMCVATAFGGSGSFRLVEPGRVQGAVAELKLPAGPVDSGAVPSLGRRLDAQYLLMGSYLPETNLAKNTVTVTLTLRLVDAGDGTAVKNFLEVGEGSSLGGAVASLVRQLSAKASLPAKAAPVPVPVQTTAPAPAVTAPAPAVTAPVPVPPPAPAPVPSVVPAPAPAPEAAIPALVPSVVPVPAPAAAPSPAEKPAQALLVLREGKVNGVYYAKGSLSRFGAKIEDFDFLLKALAGKFPPGTSVSFDMATRGAGDDFNLNLQLAKDHRPDAMAVLTLECRTRKNSTLSFKTQVQAEVQIMVLNPRTLEVRSAKTITTDFVPAKGLGEAFPPLVKEELAARMDAALPSLAIP